MKIYILICLLFVGMGTAQCMNKPQPPKQFRHLDWKAAIREIEKEQEYLEYEDTLDQILDYGVDRYEENKKVTLSAEARKKKKEQLLRRVRRG